MNNIIKLYEEAQKVKHPEAFLAQFTNCRILSTVRQDEDEKQWLATRTKGVGGSDVGIICGVNKYSSVRLLYFKKTGQYQDNASLNVNEAALERMKWGHKLEPIIADEFMERTGKRVVICPATLCHKDYEWALANIDRVIVDDEEKPVGILEIKTADARMLKDWEEGDVPTSYIYQLQWYLWITGLKYGAIAALIGGNRFVMLEVYRDDDLIHNTIFPAADRFWNYHVKNLIEPELSGSEADAAFIRAQFPDAVKNSEIALTDDEDNELAEFIIQTKQQIKELEKKMNEAIHKLQNKMQHNEIGYTSDYIIKWSPRTQVRVDTDKLKSEFPEIYEACKKTIVYRTFTIK